MMKVILQKISDFVFRFLRQNKPETPTEIRTLSTKEAANYLDVRPVTIRAWCNQGFFPNAYQEKSDYVSKPVWRIPESDVENFKKPMRGRPKIK